MSEPTTEHDEEPAERAPSQSIVVDVYALAVFLGLLAAAAAVIGVHDASLQNGGVGVTIGSAALLAVAAVLGAGAAQLLAITRRRNWEEGLRPPCKPIVLIAFLLTILLGVYVFFSAVRSPGPQRPFVVAVAILLVLGGLGGLTLFGRDARVTLPRIGTIVLGFVGTILGAWQFWFSNQYAPAHAGRAVTLDVALTLESPGTETGYDVVHAKIGYRAAGGVSVSVVGSTYTLTGSQLVRCERRAGVKPVREVFENPLPDPQRARFMANVREVQPADVLAAGKFVADGKRLDPGVPAPRDMVFRIPRGRYELLRFRAQLFAIPASVQLSQKDKPTFEPYAGGLHGYWHVDDDSWFRDLVYGRERWVVLRYALFTPAHRASADARVLARFPHPTWHKGRPSAEEASRLFAGGLQTGDSSEPFADTEVSTGEPVEPTAKQARDLRCA